MFPEPKQLACRRVTCARSCQLSAVLYNSLQCILLLQQAVNIQYSKSAQINRMMSVLHAVFEFGRARLHDG